MYNDFALGLHDKVLGAGEQIATEAASMSSCNNLSPRTTKPALADFKTDLLLAKAEPIIHGGSVSGIMHLKEGKTAAQQQLAEKNESTWEQQRAAHTAAGLQGL